MDIHPSCQKVSKSIYSQYLLKRIDNVAQVIFTGHFNRILRSGYQSVCQICDTWSRWFYHGQPFSETMNGQEAFRRLANQLRSTNSGGGPLPGKGFFAGSGLLIALVGGGLALNASLFNGAFLPRFN